MKMNKTSEQESNPPENISNYNVTILIQPRTGPCAWLAEVKIKKVPEQESNPPETDPSPESVRGQVHEPMRARWPRLWRAMYVPQDDFRGGFGVSCNFVQFRAICPPFAQKSPIFAKPYHNFFWAKEDDPDASAIYWQTFYEN